MLGENTGLYEADPSAANVQRSPDVTGASMHGMDETRLEKRGLPKWTQLKKADEKNKLGGKEEGSMNFEEDVRAVEQSMRIQDLVGQRNQKRRPRKPNRQEMPARPGQRTYYFDTTDSIAAGETVELNQREKVTKKLGYLQGTPRNTRRDKSSEVRKTHTARRALEGRQWQPRLGNRLQQDNVATVPESSSPAPVLGSDLLEDIRHEDTVHPNMRLAAREQNVRLAKGVLQDSIQALQEGERKERQIARRAALEEDMNFAEDCQSMLSGLPGGSPSRFAAMPTNRSSRVAQVSAVTAVTSAVLARGSNAPQQPLPGGGTQATESAEAKPYLPEWAAWWEPQAPAPKERSSDLRTQSIPSRAALMQKRSPRGRG